MKKRMCIVSLAAAIALLSAGCQQDVPVDTPYVSEDMTVASESTLPTETTVPESTEMETSPTETVVPTTAPVAQTQLQLPADTKITRTIVFTEDYWAFKTQDADFKKGAEVYNIAQQKLETVSRPVVEEDGDPVLQDISGDIAVYQHPDCHGVESADGKNLQILKFRTGEVITDCTYVFTSGEYGPLKSRFVNGNLVVVDMERTMQADTFSLGVLNDKGQWVSPLSSERACLKDPHFTKVMSKSVSGSITAYDGYLVCRYEPEDHKTLKGMPLYGFSVYDMEKDKICLEFTSPAPQNLNIENHKLYCEVNPGFFTYMVYDLENGTETNMIANETTIFLGRTGDFGAFYDSSVHQLSVCNYKTGTSVQYDLNAQGIPNNIRDWNIPILGATDHSVLFQCFDSERSTFFTCWLNDKGEMKSKPSDLWEGGYSCEIGDFLVMIGEHTVILNQKTDEAAFIDVLSSGVLYNPKENLLLIAERHQKVSPYLASPENIKNPIFPQNALEVSATETEYPNAAPNSSNFDTNEPKDNE